MDAYYLSKDEWDTVVELGVDDSKDEKILKKISTATKSAFTRKLTAVHISLLYLVTDKYSPVFKV